MDSTCVQTVVHVDVASDVQGCPSDADVASWVNALTARESTVGASRRAEGCPPAEADSLASNVPIPNGPKSDIWVRVELARPDGPTVSPHSAPAPDHLGGWTPKRNVGPMELAAFIVALPSSSNRPHSSPAAVSSARPVRTLVQRVSCDELLRVAALSISLLIDSKPPAPEQPARAGRSDSSDADPVLQPTDATLARPEISPVPHAGAAPASSHAFGHGEPFPVLGVRGHAGLGLNPAVNWGGTASFGIGLARWWLQAYTSFSTSAKRTPVRGNGLTGYVRATTWTFGIEPCHTVAKSLGVCVNAGYNAFNAQGLGFDVDGSEVVHFWSAGATGTYYWTITGSLRGSIGLGVTMPLTRVTMRLDGVHDPIWQMPPLSGRVSVGLDWR